MTAVKYIPWTEVLRAAPTIVKNADKLWQSVTRKKAGTPLAGDAAGPRADSSAPVEVRLQALELQVDALRKEALASSELITELATQNARLVSAVGSLLVRTRVLLVLCIVLTAGAVALLLTR